ncbi:TIGR04283 family arsenosugar biosynthesis glycosyltransferase [Azoarcus sp. L1K30]|uniref:TIGR04283 family arsenosugar biosynthesis glycosyltransferase n=1 Tax=Azoarcus sp. L1K30 TaxID=2820277 RepID=UPI001B83721B|nr:TIGR04283 family arsenosugar biosynthesis glycosyltransferase [Azoarcus sp. L1K30]MBR0564966.1 TIGR04283 family arsenosugar biosynthesis glycosyltransferase [Azoarcus sp. L1K30]
MSEERISIIVPVLDEAATLTACLMTLESLCDPDVEIIVADGGSADATPEIARGRAHTFVHAPRGRGSQMNAGAALATGDILLFLHADTRLPSGALDVIRRAISAGAQWGRFDVRIEGRSRALRLVGAMMNLRSRLSGIATGDQAIFVRRTVFDAAGGYPDIALMEDVALSGALRALAHPACLRPPVATSGRRWEKHGVLRTIVLMWRLRAAYWLGADPDELARRYGYQPRNGPQARLAGVRTEEKRPPDA